MNIIEIADEFEISGKPLSCEPYGEGHINSTYLAITDTGSKYIIQKINNALFKDVFALMKNIEYVTRHIAKKAAKDERPLTVINAKNGMSFIEKDGSFYRVYVFIDNATAYQIVENPQMFYESAVAFGHFQNMLADFDASLLTEVLPNFHNTTVRFKDFKEALKNDLSKRAVLVKKEIDFVLEREEYCDKITSLLESGKMPLRVTHNDTKLNNVMLDNVTNKAVAVIDLDTVMPGSCCYDFGDSIRFGCNSSLEDERDLSKVFFRIDLFELYVKGYLSTQKNITKIEKDMLAFSSILMTYECGMRFLADHLNGDIYFKIKREGQNLDRARTQFKLVSDMEKALNEMNAIVNKY